MNNTVETKKATKKATKTDYSKLEFNQLLELVAEKNGLHVEYRFNKKECYICNEDEKHIVKCKYGNKYMLLCVNETTANMIAEKYQPTEVTTRYSFPFRYRYEEKKASNVNDAIKIVASAKKEFDNRLLNRVAKQEKEKLQKKANKESEK